MTIDKIIEEIRGLPHSQAVINPDPLSLGDVMISRDRVESILRSSYSELLGEKVKEVEEVKQVSYDISSCVGISIDGWCCNKHKYLTEAYDTAISIINSKLPKEDKNI